MDDGPDWEIRDRDGTTEVRLRGRWNLLGITADNGSLSERLQRVAERRFLTWDLKEVRAMDSAGARLLWRAWGNRYPEDLRCRDDQQAWFRRLADLPQARPSPGRGLLDRLTSLGKSVTRSLGDAAGIALLLGLLVLDLLYCLRNPRVIPWRSLSATIYEAGVRSLPLLAFIGVLTGMVLAYEMSGQLKQFGVNRAIIGIVGLAFLRELGPFLAAIILVGRSGSTFTASIGAMQVTEEMEALRTFGASPTLRIALPKVLGLSIVMPLLVTWTDFAGVLGAMYTSKHALGVPWGMWVHQFPQTVPWLQFAVGFGKGILFGALIGLVSTYYGLRIEPNTQSLSEYTTRSVVVGLTLTIALDVTLGFALTAFGLGFSIRPT
jgi:phospholipid/cholesterol/gamma-HCH transport system permease protein